MLLATAFLDATSAMPPTDSSATAHSNVRAENRNIPAALPLESSTYKTYLIIPFRALPFQVFSLTTSIE